MSARPAAAPPAALVAVTFIAVLLLTSLPPSAGAEPRSTPAAATVLDVSPWVAPDGDWQVELGLSSEPPPGSALRYTIHQPLPASRLRARLEEILDGATLGPSLHNTVTVPLDSIRAGNQVTLSVPVRSRSGSADRALLPNPGIHPVDLELVGPDGVELFEQVLFLNHLPTATTAALRVAPVLQVQLPPVIDEQGEVRPWSTVADTVRRATDILAAAPSTRVTVLVDPQLFEIRVAGDTTATDALERFRNAVERRPLLRTAKVPVDIGQLSASNGIATLRASLRSAQQVLSQELQTTASADTWPFDPTLTHDSLPTLRSLGVTHLLLRPDQLARTQPDPSAFSGRRVQIASANSGVDALIADAAVAKRLSESAVDPALATHRAITELAGIWFQLSSDEVAATVVDLSTVDVEVATGFLHALDEDSASSASATASVSVRDAFVAATPATTTSKRRREPVVGQLVSRDVPSLGPIDAKVTELRGQARSYHATMPDPPGLAPLEDRLFTIQHRDLEPADQLHYLAAIADRITRDLAMIEPPPPRSFTVTARRAKLPMRITNRSDRPATVLIRFAGRRLEISGGHAHRVVLQPGPNSIEIPVLARTSGEFTVPVEIRSADDELLIGSSTLEVRSTVVSGVGVLLGGGALLFLVVWWAVSIRRDRRARRQNAEVPPPPESAPVT